MEEQLTSEPSTPPQPPQLFPPALPEATGEETPGSANVHLWKELPPAKARAMSMSLAPPPKPNAASGGAQDFSRTDSSVSVEIFLRLLLTHNTINETDFTLFLNKFKEHDIRTFADISGLGREDLKELGFPIGPRNRLLRALAGASEQKKGRDRNRSILIMGGAMELDVPSQDMSADRSSLVSPLVVVDDPDFDLPYTSNMPTRASRTVPLPKLAPTEDSVSGEVPQGRRLHFQDSLEGPIQPTVQPVEQEPTSTPASAPSSTHSACSDTPGAQETNYVWQRDSETDACLGCRDAFTFRKRRHHCRKCGRIFCDSCAPIRFRNKRLCHGCFVPDSRVVHSPKEVHPVSDMPEMMELLNASPKWKAEVAPLLLEGERVLFYIDHRKKKTEGKVSSLFLLTTSHLIRYYSKKKPSIVCLYSDMRDVVHNKNLKSKDSLQILTRWESPGAGGSSVVISSPVQPPSSSSSSSSSS
eukprot:CAMPEP_0175145408 /NCGR_PEP_ID=MMETSP0087-20121206/14745_1 /TAXON_ID=136419 /ORGANISM="Unknown Unknown, Strain D1" /LENGTH=470 /DNA_ID=CAMNT_0016430133 /DNA_START=53 /DNA_END=1461 /DNA_ORIENTATION=+